MSHDYAPEEMTILQATIETAARGLRYTNSDHVEYDDLVSEGWVWVVAHPQRVRKKLEDYPDGKYLRLDVRAAMLTYIERERAQRLGYHPDDQYKYGAAVIEMILPHVVRGERDQPVTGLDDMPGGKGVKSETGNWQAMWLDVQTAWNSDALTEEDRGWMLMRFVDGLEYREMEPLTGLDHTTCYRHVQAATRKLIGRLGGVRPQACDPGCLDCRLRRRPGTRFGNPGEEQAAEV